MKEFFKKNKIFIAIIISGLIIGGAIYLGLNKPAREGETVRKETSKCLAASQTIVTKVIDGDTVIVEGGYHIRLLGIDADERGYPCYEPAKARLEELVLNKEIKLEKDKTDLDQYKRCLRYIFLDGRNINIQLMKEGLAVARFYEPDVKYKEEISEAEQGAIENKIGCKWSASPQTKEGDSLLAGDENKEKEKSEFQWQKLITAKLGYDVVDACEAGKYLGRELIVEGRIADAYRDSKSNTIFLNFEKPYPNHCFTGVIFSSNSYKFVQNPENYYLNKIVRIAGEVKEYKGKPEIILESPSQIEARI